MNIPGYDAWKLATPPEYEPTALEEHQQCEPCHPDTHCSICYPVKRETRIVTRDPPADYHGENDVPCPPPELF